MIIFYEIYFIIILVKEGIINQILFIILMADFFFKGILVIYDFGNEKLLSFKDYFIISYKNFFIIIFYIKIKIINFFFMKYNYKYYLLLI